ncbi:hypothetical protein CAPTEDRAFT_206982 [Capitella teleta]|uniref:Uncharacterized protein n=1 Tax=Capitella teleta TaxID=283909 RepID=R7URS1_CAPTE|nr:hypothetical protein CAPTEDRAFT_206982 [Capitella teleta]|eukprot:ELU08905.1 hypothetical protein CAPTEDRAFT_206982 [Capitella teleta]
MERDRPRPVPRPHHHRGRRLNPKQSRRYSSSDGEDQCAGCPDCRGARSTLPGRTSPHPNSGNSLDGHPASHGRRSAGRLGGALMLHHEPSFCVCAQYACAYTVVLYLAEHDILGMQDNSDRRLANSGLTPDEHHISPIENLDHTISRLYSYLSGSEGDAETDHSLTPLKAQEQWTREPSPSASSISSRCSSVCSADDIDEEDEEDDVPAASPLPRLNMDSTLSSIRSGENFYAKINDTSTLPMPPIPPPPLEVAPGPAVPPRRNTGKRLASSGTQTLERQRRSHLAHPDEDEFEPQFIVQASDGSVFVPSGRHTPPTVSPPSVPTFPRTVPRTASLPQPPPPPVSQRTPTPDGMGSNRGFGTIPREPINAPPHVNTPLMATEIPVQNAVPPSTSTDRIKNQLKEMDETWTR